MKSKFYIKVFLLSLVMSLCSAMYAQSQEITGNVFDTDGKVPLVGCAVTVKGTQTGIISDVKGFYKIRVKENQTLVFSSLGYEKQEILVGKQLKLNVIMVPESQEIESVVVTALGMKRDEKALGYAVSKVENDVLTSTVSSNWMNSLSGKVAGLNFDQASAGPGGSMRVTLRGETSINMSGGTALFVVDGVPITSGMTSSTTSNAYDTTDGAVDFGNAASDINPEDIENVTVLKGPSATALYGSRAANGAIIITTKSGKKDKGIGVTFNSSVSFEQAGFWPDFQYEYGAGRSSSAGKPYSFYNVEGTSRNWSTYAFGNKFDGSPVYEWPSLNSDGTYTPMPWQPRNFFSGFFETGVTWNNTISIDGNNGKGTSVRFSMTDARNDWIVPNTGFTRQSFAVSLAQEINKFIKLDAKVNYYRKGSENLPMSGYGASSIMYPLLWNSSNVDVKWFEQDYRKWLVTGDDLSSNTHVSTSGDNPYYTVYEQLNKLSRDRVFGNLSASVTFTPELSLVMRTGMDLNSEFRTQQKPFGSKKYINGMYKEQEVFDMEMNNDFLLRYNKKMRDFDLSASFGGNNMLQTYRTQTTLAENLVTDREYRISNSDGAPKVTTARRQKAINSFYGIISTSWKDMLFLDVTGRNDWSSTLAPGNNSYFYPSVSLSGVLSDMFNIKNHNVNFLKLRASWANVGNDTSPFQLLQYYNNSSFSGGLNMPTVKSNYNLKPENVESWEFGFEGRFFQNRLTMDVAFYNATTTNQIISVPVDITTGFYSTVVNAGEINNRGWEVSSRIQPIKTKKGVNWTMNLTWSRNRNKVIELAPGLDSWVIATGPRGEIRAVPGGSLGDLYGPGYETAPDDAYITNEDGSKTSVAGMDIVDVEGYPIVSADYRNLGNTQAKWRAGLTNSISYRSLRLSFSFAGQWGGQAYSFTNAMLGYQGKITPTLEGRYDGLIHQGVNRNGDGTWSYNKTVTKNIETYYNTRVYIRDNVEKNTFSTAFLKMKDIRLEYTLPAKIAKKTKVLQGASIAVFATNLFCITNFPQFDPEIATMNGSEITKGFETAAFPMTRTYGVNLKLQF